jgi:adenylate kinase family enzyme
MDADERRQIRKEFEAAVNMSPKELETWLETDESRAVGWTRDGESESVGHHSGRRIVEIKRAKVADLDDADHAHMKKVVGYVHRHIAQGGPAEDKETSRWRYSLMNWGHDPCKEAWSPGPGAAGLGRATRDVIGQPGAGKSWLARELGAITRLPVFHIDQIHYQNGWVERDGAEKDRLCAAVHARERWIFEGGRASTWGDRLAWLDLPLGLRLWRVLARSVRHWGRSRPDLPEGCRERIDPSFLRWIWATRRSARSRMLALYDGAPAGKRKHRLSSRREVRAYLEDLRRAAARGNLGIPHR